MAKANNENNNNDFIFYTSPEGEVNIKVIYNNKTFWLSQKRMAELLGCGTDNISLHIKNIFKDKELDPNSVADESWLLLAMAEIIKSKFCPPEYKGMIVSNS